MSDTKWSIYRADPEVGRRFPTARYLGTVVARHQPEALRLAAAKWPDELDTTQAQGGFSAREVDSPLGDRHG